MMQQFNRVRSTFKLCHHIVLIFCGSLFLWPSAILAKELPIRDELNGAVAQFISSIPPEMAEAARKAPDNFLINQFGRPGGLDWKTCPRVRNIPEWGIHEYQLASSLVVAMATSKLKGQSFDLLGFLELYVAPNSLSSNLPVPYNIDKCPKGYEVTHILFQVSVDGEVSALYVATEGKRKDKRILVNQIHGEWREPTAMESQRILKEGRARKIGVPNRADQN